jgi:hypothetical protein
MTRTWADIRCRRPDYSVSHKVHEGNRKSPHQVSMPDPAAQLQQIYVAGFELKVFDRFPKCVGVVRNDCIALLVPTPDGLQMLGTPGWRMGEAIGVLVEIGGRRIFQAKQDVVEATPERLEALRRFREDIQEILRAP